MVACLIRSLTWAVRLLLLQSKSLAIRIGRGKEAGSGSPIYTPAALLATELDGDESYSTTCEVLGSSDPGSRGTNDLGCLSASS